MRQVSPCEKAPFNALRNEIVRYFAKQLPSIAIKTGFSTRCKVNVREHSLHHPSTPRPRARRSPLAHTHTHTHSHCFSPPALHSPQLGEADGKSSSLGPAIDSTYSETPVLFLDTRWRNEDTVRKLFDKEKGKRASEKVQISRMVLMDACRKEYARRVGDHTVA